MEKVKVLSEYCKSCGLCISICPRKLLKIGDKTNRKGYFYVVMTDQEKCIGCTLCGTICPDMALEIHK